MQGAIELKQQIIDILSNIFFKNGTNLKKIASEIIIKNSDIGFALDITGCSYDEAESLRQNAISQIKQINNVGVISIVLTRADSKELHKSKYYIDNVKKIILVASGKGGVGKSTISVALAENLLASGYKVGIVDGDIYGPSIPTMFNISGQPKIENGKIIPLYSRGIQINSIGFLNTSGGALAWRGPMASKAIYQLLHLTSWSKLDYLIIDMPPGTGDIHLAILGNYHIDGVVIVTTPQKISEIDVRKSIELYKKFDLPILSIIENMSYFEDQQGNKVKIFKGDSAEILAQKYDIPHVYKLALKPEIAEACDAGESLKDLIHIRLGE